jgi:polyisoprenoid-binding protein YceI
MLRLARAALALAVLLPVAWLAAVPAEAQYHFYYGRNKIQYDDFDIDLRLDPEDLSSLETTATVETSSIDTGIDRRDDHLRSGDFFESETYPTLAFESTGVRNVDGQRFELLGNLTIRDVTKPVVLDAEMAGPVTDMEGKPRVAFTASTRIDRKDYGLQWNRAVEGVNVVSDDVDIILDIQAAPADV